jgi:hypothetical protein
VTFNYTVKNNGTEEGTQEVTVVIKDGLGNVVNQSSRQITVNPAGSRQENFSFIFQTPGTYTVTVTAQPSGSTKSVTVTVAGDVRRACRSPWTPTRTRSWKTPRSSPRLTCGSRTAMSPAAARR